MAESARIKVTWTTSSNALSYKIYRSDSSNGPWTLLGSVPGYLGTWYDNTVDPSPFKNYYYQIVTICTNGSTSVENVTVQCQNCPTENQASIFALRDTTYNTVITPEGPMPDNVAVQYYNALSDYLNTNNNANQSVLQTATARKGQNANSRTLFCHKCGKDITDLKPNSPAPEFSYMSKQGKIASLLPTPPSAFGGSSTPQVSGQSWFADQNLGTFLQKKAPSGPFSFPDRWTFGIRDASQSSTFHAYDGGFVYSGASGPTNYPIQTSGYQSYNYGGWGYYTDEGSRDERFINNIALRTKCAGAPMFNFPDDSDPNTSWSVPTTNYFKNGNLRPNLASSGGGFTTDQNWAYLKFFQRT